MKLGRAPTGAERDGQKGAVLVEAAIVISLLVLIFAGLLEVGIAWRVENQLARSMRESVLDMARGGESRLSDFETLVRLRRAVPAEDEIAWVIIYRAGAATGDPPQPCVDVATSLTAGSDGVSDTCNVYRGSFVRTVADTDFSSPDCAGDPDRWLCPPERRSIFGADDQIGVAIAFQHRWVFGLLPGSGLDITDSAVSPLLLSEDDFG